MSIILKGIDLPNKGDILTLDIYSDGHGYASHEGEADTMDAHAIQIPYDVEDMVDDLVENHELYKKGGRII